MADIVPQTTNLKDIYYSDDLPSQSERWHSLRSKFTSIYNHAPTFVARSPGRVNIIGEHIDYNLYEVLPMAITDDMLLAVSSSSTTLPTSNSSSTQEVQIRIANTNLKYPAAEFTFAPTAEIVFDSGVHNWVNYFKTGLSGALTHLRKTKGLLPASMCVLVDGSIAPASGLSSSGAFVVASSLAVLVANGVERVGKLELAEMAVASERAIGLNGGGMDQTASVFGLQGSAIHVSFFPRLEAEAVHFPKGKEEFCFVIGQSFVEAVKHTMAPVQYNLRAVECSLAAAVLFHLAGLTSPLSEKIEAQRVTLRDFQNAYFAEKKESPSPTQSSILEQLTELVKFTEDRLEDGEGQSREEIAGLLEITVDELEARFMTAFPVRAERFKLRQRAVHVFREAARVQEFMALLQQSSEDAADIESELGRLMNESQESCREVYECSSPELDRLCDIAQRHGAYGSRLTGAGWGGCSVHLVAFKKVDAVKKAWGKEYYDALDLSQQQREDAMVVSRPGSGTFVYLC